MLALAKKIFGSSNDRKVKTFQARVQSINALEPKMAALSDAELRANRDSEWMAQVYRSLGLSVGVIVHGLSQNERQAAYRSDITYGTNNEFGFDYLRDDLVYDPKDMVQ